MDKDSQERWAIDARDVTHRYGANVALDGLTLRVDAGEIFALLGPNGSGKSTLFRLLSTLARLQAGELRVFGRSVLQEMAAVRGMLGVVFQAPSLDKHLTARENLQCQGALVGLHGQTLKERIARVAAQLGLSDRLETRVAELSGGLKRRVELAKGLLHKPKLLLMDEPSTGLDPSARLELWKALVDLQRDEGVTIVLTTHLLEEADKADRIAIVDQGAIVAVGPPAALRSELGEQVLTIHSQSLEAVREWLVGQGLQPQQLDEQLRVGGAGAALLIAPLNDRFGSQISTLTLGQPSLEDVFVAKTKRKFE